MSTESAVITTMTITTIMSIMTTTMRGTITTMIMTTKAMITITTMSIMTDAAIMITITMIMQATIMRTKCLQAGDGRRSILIQRSRSQRY